MKKYFVDYVPVEGEIEEGDITFYNNNFEKFGYDFRAIMSTEEILKLKVYKLFLCSRDIQIGDKIKYPSVLDREWIIDEFGKERDGYQNLNHAKGCFGFKIIGEISPEATWVKKGMEFDENEFKSEKWYNDPFVPTEVKTFYLIKCPTCEKFH